MAEKVHLPALYQSSDPKAFSPAFYDDLYSDRLMLYGLLQDLAYYAGPWSPSGPDLFLVQAIQDLPDPRSARDRADQCLTEGFASFVETDLNGIHMAILAAKKRRRAWAAYAGERLSRLQMELQRFRWAMAGPQLKEAIYHFSGYYWAALVLQNIIRHDPSARQWSVWPQLAGAEVSEQHQQWAQQYYHLIYKQVFFGGSPTKGLTSKAKAG